MSAAALAVAATLSAPAWADAYQDTINMFRNAQQSSKFFNKAYGYAVFPTIGKGGIGIGGAYGTGRVFQQGKAIGETSMTQLSVGFQLGAQGYSQMIFFENAAALNRFTTGEFEFSADASAIAITAGAGAKAGTAGANAGASVDKNRARVAGSYTNGMAVFTVAKGGLMYEAVIAGQKYRFKR